MPISYNFINKYNMSYDGASRIIDNFYIHIGSMISMYKTIC